MTRSLFPVRSINVQSPKASESGAGYISFMDTNLSCRINTAVLSDEEAGAVFAKIAEWKQDILKS